MLGCEILTQWFTITVCKMRMEDRQGYGCHTVMSVVIARSTLFSLSYMKCLMAKYGDIWYLYNPTAWRLQRSKDLVYNKTRHGVDTKIMAWEWSYLSIIVSSSFVNLCFINILHKYKLWELGHCVLGILRYMYESQSSVTKEFNWKICDSL